MNIHITGAPCCWGVDDVKNPYLPPWQKVLYEAGQAGYKAIDMLNYTTPLWVALLAHFLLGERLTLRRFGGIMLSFVGIYLLMDGGGGGLFAGELVLYRTGSGNLEFCVSLLPAV